MLEICSFVVRHHCLHSGFFHSVVGLKTDLTLSHEGLAYLLSLLLYVLLLYFTSLGGQSFERWLFCSWCHDTDQRLSISAGIWLNRLLAFRCRGFGRLVQLLLEHAHVKNQVLTLLQQEVSFNFKLPGHCSQHSPACCLAAHWLLLVNPVLIVLLRLLSFVTTATSFARAGSSLLIRLTLDYLHNLFNYTGGSTFWIYLGEQSLDPIQFLIHKQLLRLQLVLKLLNFQLALSLLVCEQWLVHLLNISLFLLRDEGPVQLSRLLQFSAQGFQSELVVEFFRLHFQQLLLKSSHLLLRL